MTKKPSYRPLTRAPREIRPWCVTSRRFVDNLTVNGRGAFTDGEGVQDKEKLETDPVELARNEARMLLEAAKDEANRLRQDSRDGGYSEGRALAARELEESQRQLAAVVGELREAYGRFCMAQAPELAKLALRAAERLVRDKLDVEPERITAILNHALEQITASTEITVHLNPEDVEIVRAGMAANQILKVSGVELVAETGIERGGCWIESGQGEVDATVSGRFARLTASLSQI